VKYISNCAHYPSNASEIGLVSELTCKQCNDNFSLASDQKSCVDVKTRIDNGETWLSFCKTLAPNGTDCAECLFSEKIELHLGKLQMGLNQREM
jgi:hypothetical protein